MVANTTFFSLTDTDADGSLDRLVFNLEDLRFVARPGVTPFNLNFADFTISLVSTPITPPPQESVPEPATLVLVVAALAGAGATRRLRPAVGSTDRRPPDKA